ncbi:MAG: hypothetical protein QOC55_1202 [Thermoleophilaceae bacterium]|nr:hypothetical protein [Thermoleophilaceae bacterium]
MAAVLTVIAAWLLGVVAVVDGCARAGPNVAGAASSDCRRPYSAQSPWNTAIARHARRAQALPVRGPLTSDPTQYTYPVYEAGAGTPLRTLRVDGVYSDVSDGGSRLSIAHHVRLRLPIPRAARAAAGSDAQVVLTDRATGDEWGAWQLRRAGSGFRAENAYHYNVRWNGVPPHTGDGRPFGSRGAGVPYLAGLVRRCEIARGRIDHALAFAYDSPSSGHTYPATKSDGTGTGRSAVPEGTRLQLDPSLSAARIRSWGCTRACLVIARALQRYGMFVIDSSGRPKVMFEYAGTARWHGVVHAGTVSPIPLGAFRVVP